MNAHRLAAILTGAVVTVVQPYYGTSSAVLAAVSIRDTAKDITVFIQGVGSPDSFGSGFIIAKTSKGYTVLTAAHVVSGVDRFTVRTKDGVQHAVKSAQRLSGLDLAVVQFESDSVYVIARLGNSDSVEETNEIFVAGYPKPGRNITAPNFTILDGRVASIIPTNESTDGYGLAYSNLTRAGMSGGPVFNEAGEVIAIHGRKEGEADGSATNGAWVNLGIPINRFKDASAGSTKIAKSTDSDQQAKAKIQAEAEAQRKAQSETQRKAQLEAQQKAQAETQQKAQSETQRKVQLEAQQKAQAETQRKAQSEAQQKAQAEAQQKAQAEALRKEKEATSKSQQQAKEKSADNILARVSPLNVASSKQQTSNAPTFKQVCEDIRINTIVSKRCRTEAVPPPQGSESAKPDSSEFYVSSGNAKADGGRYDKAVEDYTSAIGRNSNLAAAFFNRGLARHKLGQRDGAIADFSKAADLFRSQGETAQYQQTQDILKALTQTNS